MEGNGYIVSWCIGHLVELAQPDAYSDAWKKWNYEILPMIPKDWQYEVKKDTVAQYKVLKELMHDIRIDSVVCATEAAPILAAEGQNLCCRWQKWGFPGFHGKQLIFNARSESALEKKMFRESVEQRRIVVSATWFYEWNKNKEKNIFYRKGQPVLFMAGLYNRYQGEDRFVILTTEANDSMRPVHDRMPLVLERDEIHKWLNEDQLVGAFLQKIPPLLERRMDFEQMSLFASENSK